MAKMIPSVLPPNVKSNAEIKIFDWFKNAPGTDNWIVLYSVVENDHPTLLQGETDFLVLAPQLGCFALEVKGGRVSCNEKGIWSFTNKEGKTTTKVRGPYEQANEGMHAIINYLAENNPEGSRYSSLAKVYFGYGVMFPDVAFSNNDFGIGEDQEEVFDQSSGQNVVAYIKRLSKYWLGKIEEKYGSIKASRLPTEDQCEQIARQLRKCFDLVPSLSTKAGYAEKALLSLTEDEYYAIDATEDNSRVVFLGPAGTGKTLIALEQVRRSAYKNIALICYNKNLGKWLESKVSEFGNKDSVKYVGTLHSLMIKNIKDAGISLQGIDLNEPETYSSTLVDLFDRSLEKRPLSFEQLVVDEVQDLFSENYLLVFDLILQRGLRKGRFSFFGDFKNQSIYHAQIQQEDALEKLESYCDYAKHRLWTNCRNTPEICRQIGLNTGCWYKNRKQEPSGIAVQYYSDWNDDEQIEAKRITEIIYKLTSEGIRRSDIVILSPRSRENSCVQFMKDVAEYSLENRKKVTFSTIHAFKGLESEAIILCDISHYARDMEGASLSYVGLSRARTILIIFETTKAMQERVKLSIENMKGELRDERKR